MSGERASAEAGGGPAGGGAGIEGLGREGGFQTKDQSRPGPLAGGLALVWP